MSDKDFEDLLLRSQAEIFDALDRLDEEERCALLDFLKDKYGEGMTGWLEWLDALPKKNDAPVTMVTARGIAELAGVQIRTVYVWRHRGVLPPETGMLGGRPWWDRQVIVDWLESTGRV